MKIALCVAAVLLLGCAVVIPVQSEESRRTVDANWQGSSNPVVDGTIHLYQVFVTDYYGDRLYIDNDPGLRARILVSYHKKVGRNIFGWRVSSPKITITAWYPSKVPR